jgi:predicted DNA-binding transcriptional regulator YafY
MAPFNGALVHPGHADSSRPQSHLLSRPVESAARLLRLLSLLQTRPGWTSPQLAERMGVTTRTIRRDVTRLRDLGYPVDAEPGPNGGYTIRAGASLPPLLLDDDEAVAVAVGLRSAAGGAVVGIEDAALGALTKLEAVLPSRLRHSVDAVHAATTNFSSVQPSISASVLVTLAHACRGSERLRFTYTDNAGNETERTVEPHRLVHTGRRWYLVARDVRRDDWRTFRVDRVAAPEATGHRFTLVDPPDPVAMVSRGTAVAVYTHTAVVELHAPAARAARFIPPSTGLLEVIDGDNTLLTFGADDLAWFVRVLAGLPMPLTVREPPELRRLLHDHGRQLARANRGAWTPTS